MKTVRRRMLDAGDGTVSMSLQKGAKIREVGSLGHTKVEFWYTCDTEQGLETRRFRVTGTGDTEPKPFHEGSKVKYVGCTGRNAAALVWHLWEV
jgi:hypothetical protein